MDTKNILKKVKLTVQKSTQGLRRDFIEICKMDKSTDSFNRFVISAYNRTKQKLITNLIKDGYEYNFHCRNDFIDNKSDFTWVINPIIGINNFKNGLENIACSVTLVKNFFNKGQKVILSVIEMPLHIKTYYTDNDSTRIISEDVNSMQERACPSKIRTIKDSTISLRYNKLNSKFFSHLHNTGKVFICDVGNIILNILYAVIGKYDAVIESRISNLNLITCYLFLKNSKLTFTKLSKEKVCLSTDSTSLIVANDILHYKLLMDLNNNQLTS